MSFRHTAGTQFPPQPHPASKPGLSGGSRNVALPPLPRKTSDSASHVNSATLDIPVSAGDQGGKDGRMSASQGSLSLRSETDLPEEELITKPVEFPVRPGIQGTNRRLAPVICTHPQVSQKPTTAAGAASENRRQNVEVPEEAIVYPGAPGNNLAGFSPWIGKGQEDTMSEQAVKSGFQNKPLITNESNTARPQLWSHLKNKGGTNTLSSLFIGLIDKRQSGGRVTESSTFKPPPRVAMSNSRREAYLGELADPSFPMRKLNRSVPHTISGRILLDQCLNKDIPIPRAVWLAKCIGANDFRAFKRKSATGAATMGSEAKWIRDWTVHVEQFLKSVILSVGEPQWKSKIEYAIRLSSHLFSEQLLDDDHYLDWLLSCLESSTSQHLPVWLLFIQIYWSPLTAFRRRGFRLAETLLAHLERFSHEDSNDLMQPVVDRIEKMIVVLATTRNACLILPRSWQRYKKFLIRISQELPDPDVQRALEVISERNDRLMLPSGSIVIGGGDRSKVIHILDTLHLEVSGSELTERCLEIELSPVDFIQTVLQWASTTFRCGWHRIYTAAVVIRRMYQHQRNVDMLLWESVQKLIMVDGVNNEALYQVAAELIRSSHFSLGHFVQHLISIGAYGEQEDAQIQGLLTLLRNLPTMNQSESSVNMRFELLEASGSDPSADEQSVSHAKEKITFHIEAILSSSESEFDYRVLKEFAASQKHDVGYSIRQQVYAVVTMSLDNDVDQLETFTILERVFIFARTILENFRDYPCLADVVGIMLDTASQTLLASITQTLHYGHESFRAIGAMKPLFNRLVTSYENVRSHQILTRSLGSAILDLSTTLEANNALISQITQDLIRCEQSHISAICSPASDNAGDIMQIASTESDDEIERILSSGTTMDSPMLHRVFDRIVVRLEEAFQQSMTNQLPFGNWLSRLRNFDRISFDGMLRRYLQSRLANEDTKTLLYDVVIPILSGSQCMTLAEFAAFVQHSNKGAEKEDDNLQLKSRIELLNVLMPDTALRSLCGLSDAYRFRLEQMTFAATFPETIFGILKQLLNTPPDTVSDSMRLRLHIFLSSARLCSFLSDTLIASEIRQSQLTDLIRSLDAGSMENVRIMIDRLVYHQDSDASRASSLNDRIGQVYFVLDEFSVKFGSLALSVMQHELSLRSHTEPSDAEDVGLPSAILQATIKNASDSRGVCFDLLSGLHVDLKQSIAKLAERSILDMPLPSERPVDSSISIAANIHLDIIERTVQPFNGDGDLIASVDFVEKIRAIISFLSSEMEVRSSERISSARMVEAVVEWVEIILRLIVIRNQVSFKSKSQSDNISLCSQLLILMQVPQLQLFQDTITFIFDTVAMLVDAMTDEQRSYMVKLDCWRTSDLRFSFLQGQQIFSALDSWLGVVLSQQSTAQTNASSTVSSAIAQGGMARNLPQTPSSQPSPRSQQAAQSSRVPPQHSSGHVNRQGSGSQGPHNFQKSFLSPMQFPLKHWELLFDQGNTAPANDTALSLSMFGMKRA